MEGTLVSLRYALVFSHMKKSKWAVFSLILSILIAVAVVVGAVVIAILLAPRLSFPANAAALGMGVIIISTIIGFFWLLSVLLISGQSGSFSLRQFSIYGIEDGTLTRGIFLSSLLGIPAIGTLAASAILGLLWCPASPWLGLAGFLGGLLSAATVIIIPRTAAQMVDTLVLSPRGRFFLNVLEYVLLIAIFELPAILSTWFSSSVSSTSSAAASGQISRLVNSFLSGQVPLPAFLKVLGWLPFSAGFMIPSDFLAGSPFLALLRLLVIVASLALCYGIYSLCLDRQAKNPPMVKNVKVKGLGAFNLVSDSPRGAVLARLIISWQRDLRYLLSAFSYLVLIIIYTVIALTNKELRSMLLATPLIIGLLFGMSEYNNLAFDGKAFTLFALSGAAGRVDRTGRLQTTGILGIVFLAVSNLIMVSLHPLEAMGAPALQAGIGYMVVAVTSLCQLLAGLGICAVFSTHFIFPVPSIDQPFKRPQGAPASMAAVALLLPLGIFLCSLPGAIVGVIAAFTANASLGILGIIISLAAGVGILIGGTRAGGRSIDQRTPEILEKLETVVANSND